MQNAGNYAELEIKTDRNKLKLIKGKIIPWWVVSHLALLVIVLKLDIW